MQDRTNLTPELLQRMRRELVELLSKYVEMDKDALELNFDQEGDQMALMLSIPVIRAKDEEEIEKALAEVDNAKDADDDSDDEQATEAEEENDEDVEISEDESAEEIEIAEDDESDSDIEKSEENSENNEEKHD